MVFSFDPLPVIIGSIAICGGALSFYGLASFSDRIQKMTDPEVEYMAQEQLETMFVSACVGIGVVIALFLVVLDSVPK